MQVVIEITMRERAADSSLNEIDTFLFKFLFPHEVQNKVYLGMQEAATITLSVDITCIEPDVCGPFPSPSELPSGQTIRISFSRSSELHLW